MDSEPYLKFLVWAGEHFGFLGMLVLILVALLSALIWKVWKGLESAIRELSAEIVAMHDSLLICTLAMPTVISEFKRQAQINQTNLNERQRRKNS